MAVDKIKNLDLRRNVTPVTGGSVYGVGKISGSHRGQLSKWIVQKLNRFSERTERETTLERSMDVVSNDAHAASIVDGMAVNIAGTGLVPQSTPNAKALGWSDDDVRRFQDQSEDVFALWSKHADVRGRLEFWQIQYLSVYSMLMKGEFFRQPVMVERPFVPFYLALQSIDPSRVFTPSDKLSNQSIRDGIEHGSYGEPSACYVANTNGMYVRGALPSSAMRKIPFKNAHRPGMLHGFIQKEDDQVRGVPVLSPAMKFIRDLGDYLDFELIGAIVTSSFPVFIETSDPTGAAASMGGTLDGRTASSSSPRYQEIEPGQVLYGSFNQKPHVLSSERPGNSFDIFVERCLRAIGAAAGIPYEIVAKDFSKTNYSSARAALLEAWRMFGFYQKWLVQGLCQPCWDMALEEGWLRGMIELPKGSPDWYEARHLYTPAMWIPPKKGSIDPKKEIDAAIAAKDNNIMTLAQIIAEYGGDWEAVLDQRGREVEMEEEKMIRPVSGLLSAPLSDDQDDPDGEKDDEKNQ